MSFRILITKHLDPSRAYIADYWEGIHCFIFNFTACFVIRKTYAVSNFTLIDILIARKRGKWYGMDIMVKGDLIGYHL